MLEVMIADGHSHVSPLGLGGEELARRFKNAGGWFIALVSLPPNHYGLGEGLEDVRRSFQIHLRECENARKSDLKIACIAGIHPSFIDSLVKKAGPAKTGEVLNLLEKALQELRRLRVEGLIDGFGEFGRPHYKSLPESVVVNELVLVKTLEIIKDVGGVLHLHLEQGGAATVASIDKLVRFVGLKEKSHIFFHHSTVGIARLAQELGYMSTLTGRYEVISDAFNKRVVSFIPESDFIDDPRRPGVVMYPWRIRDESLKFLNEGGDPDFLHKVMIDNVVKAYGVSPP